ncbi:2-amino-4-hydroxy-6-hydroxymethyldihydropteridine diphosphokinase [Accumulibacter sp.]|uniref:2-amino-4-hydroxy-6- hydroxymethyldihydropteridine diphosphokinase n=1 Tax=Accumulibacter sp. TaxID=2053492 RepID=UPI00338DA7C1
MPRSRNKAPRTGEVSLADATTMGEEFFTDSPYADPRSPEGGRRPPNVPGVSHLAFVALGANLADPQAQLRAAAAALADLPESRLLQVSSLYRTAPVGIRGQPDFINAVAAIRTDLDPQQLLDALFVVERRFGRRREFHHAPRTLDLDLLLYDQRVVDSPRLSVPHPRMHLRAFVLAPLLEIAPLCRIPGRGTAAAWLPAVSRQTIERLE